MMFTVYASTDKCCERVVVCHSQR